MSHDNPLQGRIDAVVIGASAGGVEALMQILPALRVGTRAAFFIVLHLPRDRPSLLAAIFQPRCALPVIEAVDKQPVAQGTVYLAPPDYHMLLEKPARGGESPHIALSADDEVHYSRPSIDVLFETAAEAYAHRLLGLVLTGANEDGADGLAAVREAGGVTLVQKPEEAHAPAMVLAALEHADQVLRLQEIAALLGSLGERR